MVTCRECKVPAIAVKHEYENERVLFIYTHEGGVEHRIWIEAYSAEQMLLDDRAQQQK
jgi:hypothetical protein